MKKKTPQKEMGIVGISIGIILIGFAVVVIGMLLQSFSGQKSETDSKVAFVGFIGPIPFGFGNDRQWVMVSLVIAMVFFVLMAWMLRSGR